MSDSKMCQFSNSLYIISILYYYQYCFLFNLLSFAFSRLCCCNVCFPNDDDAVNVEEDVTVPVIADVAAVVIITANK